MKKCALELTTTISAAASAIAKDLSDDQLAFIAAVFNQLGDTLDTISAYRALCGATLKKDENNSKGGN